MILLEKPALYLPEVSKQTEALHIIVGLLHPHKRMGFNKILATLCKYPEFTTIHPNTLHRWMDRDGVIGRNPDKLFCPLCGKANFELVEEDFVDKNTNTKYTGTVPKCEYCHTVNYNVVRGKYFLVSDSEFEIGLTVERTSSTKPTHRQLLFLLHNSVVGGIRNLDNNTCTATRGISRSEIVDKNTFRIGNRFTDIHLTEKEAYQCIDLLIEAKIWTEIREYAEVRCILAEDSALKGFIGNALLILGYTTQRLQFKWILKSSLNKPESQWYQSIYSQEAVNSCFTEKVKRPRPIPEKEREYLKNEIKRLDTWIQLSLEEMDANSNELGDKYPVYIAAIREFVYPDWLRRSTKATC